MSIEILATMISGLLRFSRPAVKLHRSLTSCTQHSLSLRSISVGDDAFVPTFYRCALLRTPFGSALLNVYP